jgi:hypothetical protein
MKMVILTNGLIQKSYNRLKLEEKEKKPLIQIQIQQIRITMDKNMYSKVY